jgi:hypothetical protein
MNTSPTPTNRDRAARLDEILPLYPEDQHTNVIDLLADLLHWCELNRVDFEDTLRIARMHFEAERDEG